MILINLEPESSLPITKPRENDTLHDWLLRKKCAEITHNLGISLQQNKEGEK
jgi:hypothetical protein